MVAILLIAIAAQALNPIQVAASPSPESILLYDAFDGDTLGEIKETVSFERSGDNGQGFDMERCVSFDGGGTWGGYILYGVEGPSSKFVKNPGTLELWVKKDDWTSADGQPEDILRTNTKNTKGIQLLLYGAELRLSGQSTVVYDTSALLPGWHHLAIAWDNTGTILYIDGENKGSGVGITSTHNTLGLSAGEELNGCIDELATYDYKKTPSEILRDFNAESSPHKSSPGETLQAPIADAGGPYEVTEGSRVFFDGSGSSDPDGQIESYEWHLTYDGRSYYAAGPTMSSYPLGDDYAGDISLKVKDDDGLSSDTDTTTVTVSNVAPIVEAGADQTVNPGDTVSLSGSFTDPGWLDTHTIDWAFGDGSTASGNLTPTHAYGNNGVYTVTLTVTDDDGGVGIDTVEVTVYDAHTPIADVGGPYEVTEGSPVFFDGSNSSDPDGKIKRYEWDLNDDGLFDDAKRPTMSYTWGDDYAGNITLKVTDKDRLSDTDTTTVTVSNVAPIVEAGADQTVNQGDMVSLSGSFTDPGWLDTHTIDWDFGDGYTAVGDLEVDHLYADHGTFIVTLTVTDDDGGVGIDTVEVTVIDMTYQAPTADANGPYIGAEGSPITFDGGSSSDLDGTIVAYDWDLNYDGLFDDATGEIASYTWGDDYADNITLKVEDNDGLSDTDTTTVTVSNVAPIVEAGADQTVNQGDMVSLSGSFTDPGWLDTHTIRWAFGDGDTADGALEVDHRYADHGTFIVTLTVTDDDGGLGQDTLTVTVTVPGSRDLKDLKEQVINCLSMHVDESKRISKAIKKIDESLDPKLWMDETHLDYKHGKKVFDYERYAVKELMHLLKGDVSDKCSGISRIVLEYTGLGPVAGEVLLKNGLLLTPFEFSLKDIDAGNTTIVVEASEATGGKLHPEIRLEIGGVEVAKIHTSCSKPIDIGDNYGDFVIDDLDKLPQKSGKKDEISDEALACAQEGIAKLVEVDRILAETLIIETEGMTITDPKKQEKVNKELAKAHEELDKGDADRDAGKPDKAIKHYKKAWEHAQKAMK